MGCTTNITISWEIAPKSLSPIPAYKTNHPPLAHHPHQFHPPTPRTHARLTISRRINNQPICRTKSQAFLETPPTTSLQVWLKSSWPNQTKKWDPRPRALEAERMDTIFRHWPLHLRRPLLSVLPSQALSPRFVLLPGTFGGW